MNVRATRSAVRFGVAVLSVALLLVLKLQLDHLLGTQSPFLLFLGAVMISAAFGGLGPGLVATALAAVATVVVSQRLSLQVALFVLEGVLISSILATLQAGRQRAEDRERRLESEIALRQREAAERERLLADSNKRRSTVEALSEIQRELLAELGVQQLLDLIVERAAGLFIANGAIYLVDEDGALVPRSRTAKERFPDVSVPAGHGLVGTCAATRRGLIVNDYDRSPYALPRVVASGVRHAMAQPLVFRERLLGVIVMNRAGKEAPIFREDDLAVLGSFANQAVIAIENARLYEYAVRRRREAEVLARISRVINAAFDLGTVLQTIVEGARELCECDLSRIALLDPGSDTMVFRYAVGTHHPDDGGRLERGKGLGGTVWATGRPLRTDDRLADPRFSDEYLAFIREEGVVTVMAVPISIGERVEGLIFIYNRSPDPFTDHHEAILLRLADHVGIAIRNVEHLARQQAARAEAEAAAHRTEFLAGVSTVLASSLDYETTLATLTRLSVPRLADLCAVDVVEPDGSVRRLAVAHVDPAKEGLARELRQRHGFNPTASTGVPKVLRTGQSEFFPAVSESQLETAASHPEQLRMFRALGVKSAIIVPLPARGRTLGAITFVISESERRYGPHDLALAEDLARRAAIAIDNSRLYRQAQEVNRTKDEFLATLSHELRTPLNAILVWAGVLREGPVDEATLNRAAQSIERNTKLQAQLVEDLLDVSRIITGKLHLNLRPVDLAPVVTAAIEAAGAAAAAKSIRIEPSLEPAVLISGDPDRLHQVVWNLLSNAVKFSPKDGQIEVRLERTRSLAQIQVKDSGAGITAEFLPHVFERFRQADSSTTREHAGLGLGLAIVRHLVELHGGTVRAESAGPGRGATFTVELPLLSQVAKPREGQRAGPAAETGALVDSPPALAGVRLLVVEDEADAREALSVLLGRGCGAEVTVAASVREALEALERARPDVLVSDIGMAGEDGFDLIRQVRALEPARGGRIPAVALTGYVTAQDREKVLAAGYQVHLAKPIEPADLIHVVASLSQLR